MAVFFARILLLLRTTCFMIPQPSPIVLLFANGREYASNGLVLDAKIEDFVQRPCQEGTVRIDSDLGGFASCLTRMDARICRSRREEMIRRIAARLDVAAERFPRRSLLFVVPGSVLSVDCTSIRSLPVDVALFTRLALLLFRS
ncbi:hypothetical protein MPH_05721 [Macrophomina phaseolina MS6]|uniref:Uncharacterized protein n=2 Tax=Macrophomina phaseolina TaxID=35725 RepID=K2RWG3_MACPH|nr:hypothetical protein MPH_05721 [Macrophomina phaseolina MS6]KAH7049239.1 hypothetical protein B0J12DRAFT_99030 [Macrophomina phaseolina]